MLIIPALDIYQGKCVRLRQGQFDRQTVYAETPADAVRSFLDAGFSFLHVVDLEGAKDGRVTSWGPLAELLAIPGLRAEVGGGIRTLEDARRLLGLGASRVVLGSIALTLPALVKDWATELGPDRLAVAVDTRKGKLVHGGWLRESDASLDGFIREMSEVGVTTFICTDVERDGMLGGPHMELYRDIRAKFPAIGLIASGGVSSVGDLHALRALGVAGVIIGKALYDGRLRLADLREFIDEA